MKFFALAALLCLLAIPATARAQAPDADARIQTLRAQLEGFLENQQATARKNGCRLETGGAIAVEKSPSGYYALTLPAFSYTDAAGIRTEIGMVAINAAPDQGGNWNISFSVPTPIYSYDKNGDDLLKIDIGSQTANGVWNENLGHFTKLSGTYGNLLFSNLKDKSTVSVASLTLNTSLSEQDPGAWTGSSSALASTISFHDAATGFKGSLPSLSALTNLADRAGTVPMTKEQVKNRAAATRYDGLNIFAFLFGKPEYINAKITGLDAITAQLSQAMISANPKARNELLKGVVAFTALSSMGKPVPGDATSKAYDIVLNQDGSIAINGTDPQALAMPNAQPAASRTVTQGTAAPAAPVTRVAPAPTTGTTTAR